MSETMQQSQGAALATEKPIIELIGISKRFEKKLDFIGKLAQKLGAPIREEIVHAVDNVNLTIGQDLPTSKYTTASDKDPFYLNYGGYFKGDMDEVRFYNTVLSSTQITSIYNAEKP